ncbi:MAG: pyrroline-5-carboxylate reductase [Candidatus Parcubacteria bacterium]|nr:pyrroline-5-carboxylate reductase [Burkholderiales bacterium]
MSVVFIGGGNMADALIGGLLKSSLSAGQVRAVEVDGAARRRLSDKYRIETSAASRGTIRQGEIVVFAVKPQQMKEAARFSGIRDNANLVISVAAGVTLASLSRWLGGTTRIIRAMPNTPALIGEGIAGLYAAPGFAESDMRQAEAILGAVGATVRIDEEDQMNAVTAVSASGPAYVFYFIEAYEEAAKQLGLPAEAARKLALHTFAGAAKLAASSPDPVAVLRERVTSKGGTTEAALSSMAADGVKEAIVRAIHAANERGRELGKQADRD